MHWPVFPVPSRALVALATLAIVLPAASTAALAQEGGEARAGIDVRDQTRVVDPEGEVHQVQVRAAGAAVAFHVAIADENGTTLNRTGPYPANATVRDLTANLSRPLTGTTNLTATVERASDGRVLATGNATVEVQPRLGAVRFEDQSRAGDGTGRLATVQLRHAAANVAYRLTIEASDGTVLAREGPFAAGTVERDHLVRVSPPVSGETELEAEVLAADTNRSLASSNATVTVLPAEGGIVVDDQTRPAGDDGRPSIVVRRATANVDYYVDVHAPGFDRPLVNSPRFPQESVQRNLTLNPGLAIENGTTLTLHVHVPNGVQLAGDEATVTLIEPGTPDVSGGSNASRASSAPAPGPLVALVGLATVAVLAAGLRRER